MVNTSALLAHGINVAAVTEKPVSRDRRFRNNLTNPVGARAIRALAKSGMTQRQIADMMGLSQPAVSKIVRDQSWKEGEAHGA